VSKTNFVEYSGMINIDCVKVFNLKQTFDELSNEVRHAEEKHVLTDVWYQVRDRMWIQIRHKVWDQIIND
jgi:hypothetical protein